MTRLKVSLMTVGLVGLMATTAFAFNEGSPIRGRFFGGVEGQRGYEILAEKSGLSIEELEALRAEGATCFSIAEREDIDFEAIREEMLQRKFELIDEKVAAGELTEEEGKSLKERLESRVGLCGGQGAGGPRGGMMGKGRLMRGNKGFNRNVQ